MSRNGRAYHTSRKRSIISSTGPPKYPAINANVVPIVIPVTSAVPPVIKDNLAP